MPRRSGGCSLTRCARIRGRFSKSWTKTYLVARAVALPTFEGRGSLVWRWAIRQFMHVDLGLWKEGFRDRGSNADIITHAFRNRAAFMASLPTRSIR